MSIQVTDRKTVEGGLAMRETYVLISILDPDKRPVRIRRGHLDVRA